METQFKDVAHLYLGCKIQIGSEIHSYTTIEDFGSGKENEFKVWKERGVYTVFSRNDWKHIKPILRPLSSMADAEGIEVFKMVSLFDLSACDFEINNDESDTYINAISGGVVVDCISFAGDNIEMVNNDGTFSAINPISPVIAYYLSKHFDLFGLIESVQAIDATTLNPNPYL